MTEVSVIDRRVDWSAIFAGVVLTTAVALILLAFGAGLGLSVTSPYDGEGMNAALFALAAGLWLLWVQLLSFSIGGYVVGRLRSVEVSRPRPHGSAPSPAHRSTRPSRRRFWILRVTGAFQRSVNLRDWRRMTPFAAKR